MELGEFCSSPGDWWVFLVHSAQLWPVGIGWFSSLTLVLLSTLLTVMGTHRGRQKLESMAIRMLWFGAEFRCQHEEAGLCVTCLQVAEQSGLTWREYIGYDNSVQYLSWMYSCFCSKNKHSCSLWLDFWVKQVWLLATVEDGRADSTVINISELSVLS